ncbi:hypothetical protein Tco_0832991 [Tanacetum coccineum]
MSSPNYPTSDIEDAFSSNFLNYFPALPGNTSSNSSNDSASLVPIISPPLSLFHDDPYMKAYDATDNELPIPPQVPIAPLTILPPSPVLSLSPMFLIHEDFFSLTREISSPKDTKTPVGSPIPISPSSSLVRSTTPPSDYPFDESIFAELDNSLWIISLPLGNEPVPEEPNESDAC